MTDETLPAPRSPAAELLHKKINQMLQAFPTRSDLTRARFAQISMAMANGVDLRDCTPESVVMSIYGCARLGLIPDPAMGHVWVLPRTIKGVRQAQIMVGYRGYIEMAHRTGEYKGISAEVVYQNDELDVAYGTERIIRHRPWWLRGKSEPGDLWAAYATAVHVSGYVHFRVMTRADVLKHRDSSASKASKYSPWVTWEEAMWRKTAVIDLSKYLRLSAEFNMAVRWDEQAERGEAQSIQATDCEPDPIVASDHDPLLDQIDGDPGGGDGSPRPGKPGPGDKPMDQDEMSAIWEREAREGQDQ